MSDSSASGGDGRASGVAAVAGASVMFSWGFVVAKGLHLPPPVIATFRLLVGVIFLTALARIRGERWPQRYGAVIAAGLAFGVHQLLYIFATQHTSIAVVSLIAALKPIVVALAARRAVGERVPPALVGWGLVAVAGVAFVVFANPGDQSRSLVGDVVSVINLLAVTAYLLFTKRARLEGTPTVTTTASLFAVALVVVTPGLLFVTPRVPSQPIEWGLILLLALGPGNGHLLANWAHRRVSAALSSIILSLVPLFASVWAYLIFGEPYGWPQALGMALVVVAIVGAHRAETATHPLVDAVSPKTP